MLKYFSLILDLLQIENPKGYLAIAKEIEEKDSFNLHCYHRKSFLFEEFYKLIHGDISVEDFLKLGDIDSDQIVFSGDVEDSIAFLEKLDDNLEVSENDIYVFDELSYKLFNNKLSSDNILFC